MKPAILRAWPSDAQEKLGGLMELAGLDVGEMFRSRTVKDHPWVGQTVYFPQIGVVGKVDHCLIHPRGELMFDVIFSFPVPRICRGRLSTYNEEEHRYTATELLELAHEY